MGVQNLDTFKDREYEASWVTRKRTVTIDTKGNFIKTQNVDILIGKLIERYGELETTIRLAKITNLGLDMLLEFNHADIIDRKRFQDLGFITSSINRPLALMVELGFLIRVGSGGSHELKLDVYRWKLNMNGN